MNRLFQRTVGLAVICTVLVAAGLLWWGITVTDPPSLWEPARITLAGVWQVLYSSELPDLGVLVTALAIALFFALLVAVTERAVAARYRRATAAMPHLTLAPRAVMARTRGVYAGPVTVTVLIPAHNEEASLPLTLDSLRRQAQPPQRIIVVADNCSDRTVEVAR